MFKRRIALATLAAAAVAATTPIAQAQPALDKTVKVVVGFPAGGASDAVARLLACISRSTCQFITARPHNTGSTPTTQGSRLRQLRLARRLAVRGMRE